MRSWLDNQYAEPIPDEKRGVGFEEPPIGGNVIATIIVTHHHERTEKIVRAVEDQGCDLQNGVGVALAGLSPNRGFVAKRRGCSAAAALLAIDTRAGRGIIGDDQTEAGTRPVPTCSEMVVVAASRRVCAAGSGEIYAELVVRPAEG